MDLDNAVVILPTQSGSHPYEALAVGKRTIYLLDRTGLGHICTCCTTKNTQIVQELASVGPGTGTPVYWNGKLYFTSKSKVEMYPLNQGMLDSPTLSTWVRAEGMQLSARMGAMMEFSGILAAEYCLRWMQRP